MVSTLCEAMTTTKAGGNPLQIPIISGGKHVFCETIEVYDIWVVVGHIAKIAFARLLRFPRGKKLVLCHK